MTDREAAKILAVLSAAWPNYELPEATVELWIGMLGKLRYEDAKAGALDVVRQDQWFPSIARFLQCAEAQAHARANRLAARRGLPSVPVAAAPPPKRLVDSSRKLLTEMAARQHWHGGPNPCPVCGGTSPPQPSREAR